MESARYTAEAERDGVTVRVELYLEPAARYPDEDELGELAQRTATRALNDAPPSRRELPF